MRLRSTTKDLYTKAQAHILPLESTRRHVEIEKELVSKLLNQSFDEKR